jgi:hemerythrin-like metal-binding protein
MAPVNPQWSEGFSVGDRAIDAQHRAFFDEIAELAAAFEDASGSGDVAGLHARFVENLRAHFADEEAMMARIGFAEFETHRDVHRALLADVAAAGLRLANPAPLFGDPVEQLFSALVDHVLAVDMRYKTWVLSLRGE